MHEDILDEDSVEEGVSDSGVDALEESELIADKIIKSHVIASMALGLVPRFSHRILLD